MRNPEPVIVAGVVAAVINAVVLLVFGHELDKEAEAAIVSVVTLLWGVYARSQVTPVK